MIVFDLKCDAEHVFEAWFRNSEAYEDLREKAMVECPMCGSTEVRKSLMAPNIGVKSNQAEADGTLARAAEFLEGSHMVPASTNVPESAEVSMDDVKRAMDHMYNTMKKYRHYVEENCENVGAEFAAEARKIQDGTSEKRGIYGMATIDETEELLDEGIDVLPVPGLGKLDS